MGLKKIGDTEIRNSHRATCHCEAIELLLDLPDGVVDARRCDCSYCRRRGTIVASVPLDGLHVVSGGEQLALYQFNTRTAKHYFCRICGIHTHHQRRSNPHLYGYNVACLEGVNPFEIAVVPINDGINHPADRKTDRRKGAAPVGKGTPRSSP